MRGGLNRKHIAKGGKPIREMNITELAFDKLQRVNYYGFNFPIGEGTTNREIYAVFCIDDYLM